MAKQVNVVFLGTNLYSKTILDKIYHDSHYNILCCIAQPDNPMGSKTKNHEVKQYCVENNITIYQPESLNKEHDFLTKLKIDLLITCAYGQFLSDEILNLPKYPPLNVHFSLLPKLRGGSPIHYALLLGQDWTGVSIMEMVKQMDSGRVFSQVSCYIEESDDVLTLGNKLAEAGSELLMETLPGILDKTNQGRPQVESQATFAPNIKKEQLVINFNQNHETIINQIRALAHWPSAYFKLDGKIVKVLSAYFIKSETKFTPSEIVITNKDGFGISCLDGIIIITSLQFENKKEMTTSAFLNGLRESLIGKKVNG
jgi:methionyl-tRNA formyltransferase